MLVPTTPLILWMCFVAGVAFLASAVTVIVSRVVYDRRSAVLRRLAILVPSVPVDSERRREAEVIVARSHLRTLARLAAETSSPRPVQAFLARALLARIGSERVEKAALATSAWRNGWRRVMALRILALADNESSWTCLERSLVDGSREVQAASVALLAGSPDRRAPRLLVEALRAGRDVRSRIATALDAFPTDIRVLIEPLLDSDDGLVRFWGAVLMRRYAAGPGVALRFVALASDPEPFVRKAAVDGLAVAGGARAADALRARLADEAPYVRAHAARALSAVEGTAASRSLLGLLADAHWVVRNAAKESLEALGTGVIPALRQGLDHPDAFARDNAAELLANLGVFEQLLALPGTPAPDDLRAVYQLSQAGGGRVRDAVLARMPTGVPARARETLSAGERYATHEKEVA